MNPDIQKNEKYVLSIFSFYWEQLTVKIHTNYIKTILCHIHMHSSMINTVSSSRMTIKFTNKQF